MIKRIRENIIWIVVITSILLNIIATRYELAGHNLVDHPYLGILLYPFSNVRYGYYVARKLALSVIAFLVSGYWLSRQKGVVAAIQKNKKYLIAIGMVLLFSRILTYGFWFYNDDTRFFNYHLYAPTLPNYNPQSVWGPFGFHPIAILLLVIRWFGTNYTLYNTLGLVFYFFAGVLIFVFLNKVQKNKFVSFLAAIFFLTTPTYFQGRLLIGEIINSPYILILIVISFYFLFQKFLPGSLIFAAAALDYGVAKSYFIAIPLTLFAIFVVKLKPKSKLFLYIVTLFLMSYVYKPAFFGAPGGPGTLSELLNQDALIVYGDVLQSVILPHGIAFPLIQLFNLIFNGWIYINTVLGFSLIASFFVMGVVAYRKKKHVTFYIILIGLSIIIPTAALGSLKGVRVDRNVEKLVEYFIHSQTPTGATGYGFFPALGLTFIFVALASLLKRKGFKIFAFSIIFINLITSMAYDYKWLNSPYSLPQRKYDSQLKNVLHRDGIGKYVYVPSKQRPLFQGVETFVNIFQGDQTYYLSMDSDEFVAFLEKDKPSSEQIYYFITSGKPDYKIYDYSNKIRNIPYDELAPIIQSLNKELVPDPTYF